MFSGLLKELYKIIPRPNSHNYRSERFKHKKTIFTTRQTAEVALVPWTMDCPRMSHSRTVWTTAVSSGLQAILGILGSPQSNDQTADSGCRQNCKALPVEVRVGHVQTLSVNALSILYRSAKQSPTRTAPFLMPTMLLHPTYKPLWLHGIVTGDILAQQ